MLEGIQSALWNTGGFIVVLGVLIFIHELGHFTVAKWLGIRVETFSLGFGPRILGFRRGDTDYRLSLVPLGGYVKMLGELPDEELEGSEEEFQSRTKFERFLVLVMGPAVNIAFAYVLYVGVFMAGVPEASYVDGPPLVGVVTAGGSAEKAGLLEGDRVLAADGETFETWNDLRMFVVLNPETTPTFTVDRDGETFEVPIFISAENKHRSGDVGLEPAYLEQVHEIQPGSPAEAAGLQPGDLLYSVAGERLTLGTDRTKLASIVEQYAGVPMSITVLRDAEQIELSVTPSAEDGTIGISHGFPQRIVKLGFIGALGEAGRTIGEESLLLFKTLKKLVTGSLSMRALSGPLEIASFSGTTASLGLIPFLRFMGMVSLQLGIINLFPIPILDGGQITILAAEGVARREFSPAVKERFMMVGLVMILALMAVVIYFDFVKLFFS